jgi:hypothetical protein
VPGVFESPASNRADSDFDVRQSLHAGLSYAIHGWGLDAIVTSQSALPIDVTFKRNIGFGSYALRADLIPDLPVWLPNPDVAGGRQLNPAALIVPVSNAQGSLGRNALRGFPLEQTDLAMRRAFHITEKLDILFRADLFNALNHPNFANPVSNLGSGLFGISTATAANSQLGGGAFGLNSIFNIGAARSIQLSLKARF